MATRDENYNVWNNNYDWSSAGNEWASNWGNATVQWHAILMPRIHVFLGCTTILEIGPGFGRWTHFLKEHCQQLLAVDLAPKCVAACQERFRTYPHVQCFQNDGVSLAMVADQSVDFIFSFDSLVHADQPTLAAYLFEMKRVLRHGGHAFIHHSNLGMYALPSGVPAVGWRATDVSAASVYTAATAAGLKMQLQELLTWRDDHCSDCFSLLVASSEPPSRPPEQYVNTAYRQQRELLQTLVRLYTPATE